MATLLEEVVMPDLVLASIINPSSGTTINNWKITPSADGNGVLSFQQFTGLQYATQFSMSSSGTSIHGTTTNDNAAAGYVGEYFSANSTGTAATVTISIASPAVITWTSHGLSAGSVVTFTTTVALPTGLTAGTPYYVISTGLTSGSFQVSATAFGTAVNTSGTQSGTQTGTSATTLSNGVINNIGAIQLTAGDWDVSGVVAYHSASGTTIPADVKQGISTTSATLGALGTFSYDYIAVALAAADDPVYPTPVVRISIAATTTVYLIGMSDFTVSTLIAYGQMRARRVR